MKYQFEVIKGIKTCEECPLIDGCFCGLNPFIWLSEYDYKEMISDECPLVEVQDE